MIATLLGSGVLLEHWSRQSIFQSPGGVDHHHSMRRMLTS
jgi:hypothetical protein